MKPVQIQIRYWHLFTFDVKILCISGEAYRLLREELSKLSWKKQPARLQNFVHFCEPIRAPDCCNLPACHRENEDKIQHTCYPSFINCSSSLPGGSHAARHIPPFWGNCSQKPGEMRRSRLTLAFVNVFRLHTRMDRVMSGSVFWQCYFCRDATGVKGGKLDNVSQSASFTALYMQSVFCSGGAVRQDVKDEGSNPRRCLLSVLEAVTFQPAPVWSCSRWRLMPLQRTLSLEFH